MQVTNYDVLLEDGKSFRLANEEHVGNKRFEVFLNLHRESYEKAKREGNEEETEIIVGKIIDIVCEKCIPNGRFLQRTYEEGGEGGDWKDLGAGNVARLLVHKALSASVQQHRSSKVFTHPVTSNNNNYGANSNNNNNSMNSPNSNNKKQDEVSDADLKRRRRGSYARLRRSISESMLFHSSSDSMKPPSSFNGGGSSNNKSTTTSMEQMDVVLILKGAISSSNHPGNARFRILIEMQKELFIAADEEERQEILNDLIHTVQQHWKGRFLSKTLDGYQIIHQADLNTTLSTILIDEKKNNNNNKNGAGLFANWSLRGNNNNNNNDAAAAMVSNFNDESNIKSRVPNIQSLRSAAIEGLKARKQKRQIMNRLGRKNNNGNNGNASVDLSKGIFVVAGAINLMSK